MISMCSGDGGLLRKGWKQACSHLGPQAEKGRRKPQQSPALLLTCQVTYSISSACSLPQPPSSSSKVRP